MRHFKIEHKIDKSKLPSIGHKVSSTKNNKTITANGVGEETSKNDSFLEVVSTDEQGKNDTFLRQFEIY